MFDMEQTLWSERYRPHSVKDTILPKGIKKIFKNVVKDGNIGNYLFFGKSGVGKTTLAKALCEEIGLDYIIVNASNKRGIDLIRSDITNFATTVSLTGKGKCFILDEADQLTESAQAALRHAIEEFSTTCSFIFTANYPNRIADAIRSRLTEIDFSFTKDDEEYIKVNTYKRMIDILSNENVEYDDSVLIKMIESCFPDNRRLINKLQHYSNSNKGIDSGILLSLNQSTIEGLMSSLKKKKFSELKQWAVDNSTKDTSSLYEEIYHEVLENVEDESKAESVLILNNYQIDDSKVASKELHLIALCVELMMGLKFK